MKQLVILVALVVAGYFSYQQFFSTPQQENASEEDVSIDSGSFSIDQLPPIPGNCEGPAKNLENAIYGSGSGQVSFAQRNTAYRKFQSCLRDAGFSTPQINGTIAEIENRVKGYLNQDGAG